MVESFYKASLEKDTDADTKDIETHRVLIPIKSVGISEPIQVEIEINNEPYINLAKI